jgi:hypothetical protein
LSVREGHLMSTKREVIPLPVRTPDTASGSVQLVSMIKLKYLYPSI